MIKAGQIVEVKNTVMYKDTKISLCTKGKVLAVGAKESFILLEDIETGRMKNMYLCNSILIPITKKQLSKEEVL